MAGRAELTSPNQKNRVTKPKTTNPTPNKGEVKGALLTFAQRNRNLLGCERERGGDSATPSRACGRGRNRDGKPERQGVA
jgi:hypothetical protein